jgi:hypothetical protein
MNAVPVASHRHSWIRHASFRSLSMEDLTQGLLGVLYRIYITFSTAEAVADRATAT